MCFGVPKKYLTVLAKKEAQTSKGSPKWHIGGKIREMGHSKLPISTVAAVLARPDGQIPEAMDNRYRKLSAANAWSPSRGGGSGENELTAVDFVHGAFSARERLCEKYQKDICISVVAKREKGDLLFSTKSHSSDYRKLVTYKDVKYLHVTVSTDTEQLKFHCFNFPFERSSLDAFLDDNEPNLENLKQFLKNLQEPLNIEDKHYVEPKSYFVSTNPVDAGMFF
jgi:hypothetical protein